MGNSWDRLANPSPVAVPYYVPSIQPGKIILEPGLNGYGGRRLGQVPGVDHGPRGATTRGRVDSILSSIPADQAKAIRTFFSRPRRPKEVADFVQRWAGVAWNTRVAMESLHAKAEREIDDQTGLNVIDVLAPTLIVGTAIALTVLFPPVGISTALIAAGAGGIPAVLPIKFTLDKKGRSRQLARFIKTWRDSLKEYLVRWNARFVPKQKFLAYLDSLPADANISAEASLEGERQAASFAMTTKELTDFGYTSLAVINSFRSVYADEASLAGFFRDLGLNVTGALKAATAEITKILAAVLGALAAGAARGLGIPSWLLWTLGLGAAGVAFYVLVGRNPIVVGGRKLLGGGQGTEGLAGAKPTYQVRWRDEQGNRKFNLYHSAEKAREAMRALKKQFGPAGVWITKLPYTFGRGQG